MSGMDLKLIGLLTLIISSIITAADARTKHRAKVLILGAGTAGITAAKYLHDHGIDDFIIIEAENRIGGRVKDVQFGGKTIELGANWVHGTDGNPLWDLVKKYQMVGTVSDYEDYVMRDVNGNDVTDAADEAFEKYDKADRAVERIREFRLANNKSDLPLRAALRFGGWPIRRTDIENSVEAWNVDFDNASPPDETTVLHQPVRQEEFKEEDFFVTDQRGYAHVLKMMAQEFLKDGADRLRLNKIIKRVKYTDQGVVVTTKSGDVFKGDYAICTFSLGVMQSDVVKFVPKFPREKQLAINSYTMATYTKIFVRFDESVKSFWDTSEYILYAHTTRAYYPLWQNLEAKDMFPVGTNMLLVTVTGSEADRISRLEEETVKAELTKVLRNMYGAQVPEPVEILIPDWHNNPLYFGSYSNWPQWVTPETQSLMGAPLKRLYFAGEGYSAEFYGYLHGAMLSANGTAHDIISCMQKRS